MTGIGGRARGPAAALGLLLVASLLGCATESPDTWRLAPLEVDNSMGAEEPQMVDSLYPMQLAGDTAGGFWGQSAGSWLHVDGTGQTVSRFNFDVPGAYLPVAGFDAVSETLLAVTAQTDLLLFDTERMTVTTLQRESRLVGDVATTEERVYYVVYGDTEGAFDVVAYELGQPGRTTIATLPGAGVSAAIDVDADGDLFVATEAARSIRSADGSMASVAQSVERPDVAVGGDGRVLWTTGGAARGPAPFRVAGGSGDARRVLDEHIGCPDGALLLADGLEGTALPFLCRPSGLAWPSADSFVASVGSEGGAPLVRATRPH